MPNSGCCRPPVLRSVAGFRAKRWPPRWTDMKVTAAARWTLGNGSWSARSPRAARCYRLGSVPPGSGKTTAMRALAFVLHQGGQRLIPLATSAAAADVLGRELGVHADNLHKFLYEHTRGPARGTAAQRRPSSRYRTPVCAAPRRRGARR